MGSVLVQWEETVFFTSTGEGVGEPRLLLLPCLHLKDFPYSSQHIINMRGESLQTMRTHMNTRCNVDKIGSFLILIFR